MPTTTVALTLDSELRHRVDHLVARDRFRLRSQAVETALAEYPRAGQFERGTPARVSA